MNSPRYGFGGTWDVEAAGGHIGAQQDAGLCLAELEEGGGPLLLLLLAVDVLHGDVHVVEQLSVVFHTVAAAEEHHHLRRRKQRCGVQKVYKPC